MTCNKVNFNLTTIALFLVMFSFAIVSSAQSGGTVAIFLKNGEARYGQIIDTDSQGNITLENECGIFLIPPSEIDSIKVRHSSFPKNSGVQSSSQTANAPRKVIQLQEKGYYNVTSLALLMGQGQDGFIPVPSITTVNGWQVNKRLFTGIGIGFEYYEWSIMPLFADVKYMLGKDNVQPFVSFKLGYGIPIGKSGNSWITEHNGGIQLNPEVGVRLVFSEKSSLLLSIGYHYQQLNYKENNYYYWGSPYETTVHTDYNRVSLRAGFLF